MFLTGKAWNLSFRERLQELKAGLDRGSDFAALEAIGEIAALTGASRHYLAAGFNEQAKAACATHHYKWLLRRLAPPVLSRLIDWHHEIWSAEIDGIKYSATIYVESFVAREGGLTLEFFAGDISLFLLTFSFVPGPLVGVCAPQAILASRLQGRPDRFEELRRATKALSEVAPRAALFAALAGVAKASGVRYVAGVEGANTINFKPEKSDALERQYDAFFLSLDAMGPLDGFYLIDLEAEPKPVNEVKAGHRIRTRRKRLLKAQITQAVAQAWAERFLTAQDAAAPALAAG